MTIGMPAGAKAYCCNLATPSSMTRRVLFDEPDRQPDTDRTYDYRGKATRFSHIMDERSRGHSPTKARWLILFIVERECDLAMGDGRLPALPKVAHPSRSVVHSAV